MIVMFRSNTKLGITKDFKDYFLHVQLLLQQTTDRWEFKCSKCSKRHLMQNETFSFCLELVTSGLIWGLFRLDTFGSL